MLYKICTSNLYVGSEKTVFMPVVADVSSYNFTVKNVVLQGTAAQISVDADAFIVAVSAFLPCRTERMTIIAEAEELNIIGHRATLHCSYICQISVAIDIARVACCGSGTVGIIGIERASGSNRGSVDREGYGFTVLKADGDIVVGYRTAVLGNGHNSCFSYVNPFLNFLCLCVEISS